MKPREPVLRGVYAYGFERPSGIQQKAIVPFARGHDLIAQARSGTGKTAAYAVGILERLDYSSRRYQALVLTPTRELAFGVSHLISVVGCYLNVACFACVGGVRVDQQFEALGRGTHVIVGTPGRVLELIHRGAIDPRAFKVLILDEVDKVDEQLNNID